jgi:hypothetical protein
MGQEDADFLACLHDMHALPAIQTLFRMAQNHVSVNKCKRLHE